MSRKKPLPLASFCKMFVKSRSSEQSRSTQKEQRLGKVTPGEHLHRYSLERTSFEHISACHYAKKQLLHDLFWLPCANRVMDWLARKYDGRSSTICTPTPDSAEPSEPVGYSHKNKSNDQDTDETLGLLAETLEPELDHTFRAELPLPPRLPDETRKPASVIANPDLVPPSPSIAYELHSNSISRSGSGDNCAFVQQPLISPLTAAFTAFNEAPFPSQNRSNNMEPRPCRLYVRAVESYADGIISFAKTDKLLVTAQRGGYMRYEPSRSVVGWFPSVYCEVIDRDEDQC